MKWKKEKPRIVRSDLIIMNFNKKNKIHKNVRLRRSGFYVFRVGGEYAVVGEVKQPCSLGEIPDIDLKPKISIKRNIKELHNLVENYYNNPDEISNVDKLIVQKLLDIAKAEASKQITSDYETNTWWRMCCLWDKIRTNEENKES